MPAGPAAPVFLSDGGDTVRYKDRDGSGSTPAARPLSD
jgi:hypothetical protein